MIAHAEPDRANPEGDALVQAPGGDEAERQAGRAWPLRAPEVGALQEDHGLICRLCHDLKNCSPGRVEKSGEAVIHGLRHPRPRSGIARVNALAVFNA